MKIGVILAGGRSSRFNSLVPKGLHKIDGKSIVRRILDCFDLVRMDKVYIIVNDDNYKYYFKENFNVDYLFQNKANGTGSAFYCFNGLFSENDEIVVVNSDCFMFDKTVISSFLNECRLNEYSVGLVVRQEENCKGYGRVVIKDNFVNIVEENELDDLSENINVINTGIYFFNGIFLKKHIKILNNDLKENKITSLISKDRCLVYKSDDLIMGINNKEEFVNANKLFYLNNCNRLIANGVKIYDVNNTYIGENVKIGRDVEIYPNNYLLGECFVGDNSVILPNCFIEDSIIGEECCIGPFANLKKGSCVGDKVVIGAFVEVKNSIIKSGVKAKHHAYLGDVEVGEKTNIGCGTIIANYDGKNKHRTYLGKKVFVGSNVTIVSPVEIGDNVVIGAGSTIVNDINDNSLAIARERQVNKENYYNYGAFRAKKNH